MDGAANGQVDPGRVDAGRVVVGMCRSLAGYQALRYAAAEARRRNATLIVVRAFNAHAPGEVSWRAALAEAAAAEVRRIFADALGGIPRDLSVKMVAREGVTGMALVAAAEYETDVLVIGGSASHGLSRPFSGGVARYCARHAVCPVVIVPPPAMARSARTKRLARAAALGAEELLRTPASSGAKPMSL